MKAMVCTRYGEHYAFSPQDRPIPAPSQHELVIRIHATTVASGDVVRAKMGGFLKSKTGILGQEFAGVVTEVGNRVTRFRVNDRVFGIVPTSTHAEYMTVSERSPVSTIPESVSYEVAASLPFGAGTALHFLQNHIREGHRILINGASGAVGSFAVQYANYRGAAVTAVCSTKHLERVAQLGVDDIVDYTQEDFRISDTRYDLIFHTAGHLPYSTVKHLLKPQGMYVAASLNGELIAQRLWTKFFARKKVRCGIARFQAKYIEAVREMLAKGVLQGVIDSSYPLHRLQEAFRYVEQGHKTGSVIILP